MRLEVRIVPYIELKPAELLPRVLDDQELQVVCNIIQAAIWYTLAEEVEMGVYLKTT